MFASTPNMPLCRSLGCRQGFLLHPAPLELGWLAGGRDKGYRSKYTTSVEREIITMTHRDGK